MRDRHSGEFSQVLHVGPKPKNEYQTFETGLPPVFFNVSGRPRPGTGADRLKTLEDVRDELANVSRYHHDREVQAVRQTLMWLFEDNCMSPFDYLGLKKGREAMIDGFVLSDGGRS